ncbi:unnamed protein product [Withania somnifera]
MVRVSCKFTMTFLNCVNIVVSSAMIGFSIWLRFTNSATLCEKVWVKPLLIVGIFALVYSVIGLVASLSRLKFFLWLYMISSFLFHLGLLCLTVFSILVTNRNVSRGLFGRGGGYSHYLLQNYVVNAEQIKSCVADYQSCQFIPTGKGIDFYKYNLSNIQSSCCKPPTYCGLKFQNATHWIMPKAGPAVADNDCKIWSNVQSELCFNCQSCKTTFLDNIQNDWRIGSLISFVVLVTVFCVPCCVACARRKNSSQGYQSSKVYPV